MNYLSNLGVGLGRDENGFLDREGIGLSGKNLWLQNS